MKYALIDTSQKDYLIAACNGDQRHFYRGDINSVTSKTMLVDFDCALNKVQLEVGHIEHLGVVIGPGSFTGSRLGVATAKGICFLSKTKLYAINSLELLAYGVNGECFCVVACVGGWYYCASFDADKNPIISPCAVKTEQLVDLINNLSKPTLLCGHTEILALCNNDLVGAKDSDLKLACFSIMDTSIKEGKRQVEIAAIEPLYLRKSQAEMNNP